MRKVYTALLDSLSAKEFGGKLVDKETADLIVPRSLSRGCDRKTTPPHNRHKSKKKQRMKPNEDLIVEGFDAAACSRNMEQLVTEQSQSFTTVMASVEEEEEQKQGQ